MNVSAFDTVWALVGPVFALGLRDPNLLGLDGSPSYPTEAGLYLTFTIIASLLCVLVFRLGDGISALISAHDVKSICMAAATAATTGSVLTFMLNRLDHIPRSTPLICFLVLSVGWAAIRVVAQQLKYPLSRQTADGDHSDPRRVLLVGIDRFAALAIRITDCQTPRTVQFVAALDERQDLLGRTVNGVRVVGKPGDITSVIEEYSIHGVDVEEVWTSALKDGEERTRIEHACEALGLKHTSVVDALNLRARHPGTPPRETMIPDRSKEVPLSGFLKLKRVLDIAVAAPLCVLLAPVALVVAAVVAVDVGSPVMFWQERVGYRGRKFLLYKFRTLRAPYDRHGRLIHPDQRLSRLGSLVRRTRLDEIPQLFNVLRGNMSLIGPRPLLPVDQPSDPSLRLSVRPGLTGWAQVNGGNLVTVQEKDALDAWYICHASLFLDLRISVRTILYFVEGERRSRRAIDDATGWWRVIDGISKVPGVDYRTGQSEEGFLPNLQEAG